MLASLEKVRQSTHFDQFYSFGDKGARMGQRRYTSIIIHLPRENRIRKTVE